MPIFDEVSHEKYTGSFGKDEKKHLLSRTLFGHTLKNLKEIQNLNLDQTIALLFAESPVIDPPLNHYEAQNADTTGIPLGKTWIKAAYGDGTINSRRVTSLRGWWTRNMHLQTLNVKEKLILFWHNHFATELPDYDDARFGFAYQDAMRTYATGDFKKMVKAMTLDPAMLLYLNGHRNTKAAPDENYARELQELFTLGKGPNSKYTEDDVKAAAKVLTGFRADRDKVGYLFQPANHDTGDKTFSAFYGNKVIKGKTGVDGEKELDELIDMIFTQTEVSKFIIRRLYSFYFYYDITPDIEDKFITPLATIFRQNNYQLAPTLKAMFSSKHFFDLNLRGAMIKSPIDHVISALRILNPEFPKETMLYEYVTIYRDMAAEADKAQQILTAPPNVAGWPAYYQEPVFHEIWINSTTLMQRVRYTDTLINKGFKKNNESITFNPIAFLKTLDNPQDPIKLVDELEFHFLHSKIDPTLKKQLKTDFLLSGQTLDSYWTELWNESVKTPNNTNITMVTSRINKLLTYITGLPEYQLS
jgi:uncharacterized protein (DUF1800 family)